MAYDYDLFVIGAGSGGLASSKRAASYGAKVAIAENDLVGGTCVIRGCVPKKLMVYASHFSHYYKDAVGYGWSEVEPSFDWKKLVDVVDKEVRRLSELHISFLEKAGVELIRGYAKFIDPHTLEVGDRKVTADKILIATGGHPIKPDIPGIEHSISSDDMFLLSEQPKRFAVWGGGYIGVEFAGILNGLGSQVTQIIRRDFILHGFDQDIRSNIQEGMSKHGVNFHTNTTIEKIEKTDEGLKITLTGEQAENPLIVDQLLCATGRQPNLGGLMLENAGVEVNANAIAVTPDSQTSQPNIYAVGDCTDRVNLTPVAIAEGRAFADTEYGHTPRLISHENIATAVFSQPEAATVGMTEEQAKEKFGEAIKCYKARFRPMFHSLTGSDEKVFMKLVVESNTDRVLGAHMVGKDAAELIQGVAIAVNMGATKKDFDNTMGIHPSSGEEFVTMR
ncbi:MAG: glutathione-disulfide reductase [Limnoraphis robusta]|uniref:Glutathione reductase n=2 Tax=Limnoraphis robusta TaxID=1118279 RepID=A0A0F5YMK5_9CYAN|nr:glutathione-disulfide reductase [Limnoraphis robusta]KKD39420.1 glutathione reductase [Limnoraphis robusta CS-951]MEA5495744.1 glutathione-disulfide reductase [Limnoraphis robusta BA-68 BA1]MEA5521041.1 glutathione-disulfide reductase [Limnoraphis robusta CCNP1315]MEA5540075.1 glutathione-disulfide reductase [Limnoraphis robusta Tam1]MEA5543514.1 glutathione-disulfide reductase [Limnoraphis robusta CCNP1324]